MSGEFLLTVLLLTALLLIQNQAYATETVTTGDLYPPYVDSGLQDNGLMVPAILKILDLTEDYFDVEMVYEPWARGYEQTRQGVHLGTFPYVWDEKRDKAFYYSDPVYDISSHLYARDEGQNQTWTFEILKAKKWTRICRPNGYSLKELEKPLLASGMFEVYQPSDLPDCFRLLQQGRVDLIPIDPITGQFILRDHGVNQGVMYFKNALFEASLYFIVSKQREDGAEVIRQFNQAMKELKQKGELVKMRERFLSVHAINSPINGLIDGSINHSVNNEMNKAPLSNP
ncbi:ABC transporter substrate-binding protein [Litoribacillus peritrichatus]|uniref:Transporter substrate-binding domain-containing protein n=1 Tax=Litoribacillus peritrichatus TaxID=718191 RepID=A0ABP7N8M0_9GAMM